MLDPATASHSLGETLGLGAVPAREICATLDWLGSQQSVIETALAHRHLKDGALALDDVTSTYLEGRHCELARHGYSRDNRADRPQLVIGLLCASDVCPVAVQVFEGNTADPATLAAQIGKLKDRFKLTRVVVVGDCGMITDAHQSGPASGRSRLDHRAAPHDQGPGRRQRAVATLAVRRSRHGRSPARTCHASSW
jgi:hypothetical protein